MTSKVVDSACSQIKHLRICTLQMFLRKDTSQSSSENVDKDKEEITLQTEYTSKIFQCL